MPNADRSLMLIGGATAVTLAGGSLTVGREASAATVVANESELRDAITAANASPGPDTIQIAATTITLTDDLPPIFDELTVIGASTATSIIDAAGYRVFESLHALTVSDLTIENQFLAVWAASDLTLSHVSIRNGIGWPYSGISVANRQQHVVDPTRLDISYSEFAYNTYSEFGAGCGAAAVWVPIEITIDHTEFRGNSGAWRGGAVCWHPGYGYSPADESSLTIRNSTFTANQAPTGGAVFVKGAPEAVVLIEDTVFDSNSAIAGDGGAIAAEDVLESFVVRNSTFTTNDATERGGAVVLSLGGSPVVTIEDSVLSGNTAGDQGGALRSASNGLTVRTTTIDGNSSNIGAGAIDAVYLRLENSTVSNNSSDSGPGALRIGDGAVVLDQVTITGNDTTSGPAAVYFRETPGNQPGWGDPAILNSTVSGNTGYGAGVLITGSYDFEIRNSIIAGNASSGDRPELYVPDFASLVLDHSIVGSGGSNLDTAAGSGNLSTDDPMLESLADNGGRTLTMAPSPGSPAIDAGDSGSSSFSHDQRGEPWLRVAGSAIDIGAIEDQEDPLATTTTTTTTTPEATTTEPAITPTTDPVPTSSIQMTLPPTGGGTRSGVVAALVAAVGAVMTLGATRRRRIG